jgi:hypothetical protein
MQREIRRKSAGISAQAFLQGGTNLVPETARMAGPQTRLGV